MSLSFQDSKIRHGNLLQTLYKTQLKYVTCIYRENYKTTNFKIRKFQIYEVLGNVCKSTQVFHKDSKSTQVFQKSSKSAQAIKKLLSLPINDF